jgi:hypothetical protein
MQDNNDERIELEISNIYKEIEKEEDKEKIFELLNKIRLIILKKNDKELIKKILEKINNKSAERKIVNLIMNEEWKEWLEKKSKEQQVMKD